MNFLDADYSAIEARIVNWLAGQEDALERFRRYDAAPTEAKKHALDPYRLMASTIYGIPVAQVTPFPHRFIGKGAELGCGFGLGPPKFRDNCKKQGGYDLPLGLEYKAVKTWRATHKKTVQMWYDLENAAKHAIVKKNTIFHVGKEGKLSFLSRDIEGMHFLLMRLPSGRKLSYPKPRISNDRITIFGHQVGTNWGDVSLWGGVFANNCTQAVAADIMANGVHQTEAAGYETATLIHDENLAYTKPGQTVDEFVRLLASLPTWASSLPIAAEGASIPFYKKS